jgi:hypothetical protein
MQNYSPAIIAGIIGLITTIIAAFLSAKWGARQALHQRWWERKEQAYTEIIEALHDLIRYSSMCAEEYLTNEEEHPKKEEFRAKYSEAYWKIQKMTDIGPFVISNTAANILKDLRNKPKLDWNNNPPWDIYEADCGHYRKALDEIRQCAKKDLKIR